MKKPQAKKNIKQDELQDLFAELKSEYLDSFPEKIQIIEKCWQTCNREELQSEFHKIKGTGTTYGIREVTEVAEIMEDLCIQSHPSLGVCVMVAVEIFKKICENHRNHVPYELSKDRMYKFLRQHQDQLESA